ncbi:MAG TPA: YXWGXW repeat-containing protein [Candidatus Didemnitutus sp.]|nr:YXWGXW repeat-containing protein [Candidatus Didemnitutus sp.]
MISRYVTVPALALSVLLGGCASSGPNAQRGAAAGGALGAIAGAIIGNNSHGGNGATGALIGAAFGAVAGGAAGSMKDEENAAKQQQRYDSSVPYQPPQHHRTYSSVPAVSHVPSPPSSMPNETIPPSPNSAAIWVPGYWDYNGVSYVWMPGRWEIPPPDKQDFMAGHWEVHDNAYVFVRGHWE